MIAKPTTSRSRLLGADLASLCLTMTEHAPLPMATMGGARHIVRYVNPAFCRLLEIAKEDLLGKPFPKGLPESEECQIGLDRVYRTGIAESHTESEVKVGHPLFWSYSMWPVITDEEPVGVMIQVTETAKVHDRAVSMVQALMLGSVRQHKAIEAVEISNAALQDEILERMQVEAALRASEERYRNLFNSMDEGFCVIELVLDDDHRAVDYRFLEVNPSFEKQSGLRGALGRRMRELVPTHEAAWVDTYEAVARTGQPIRFENEAKGLNRWFDVYAFPLAAPERDKVAILFNDITSRKQTDDSLRLGREALQESQGELSRHAGRLEEQVSERTAELTATNQQLEAFVYSIAHDLRAPLRAMQGFSEMLMEDPGTKLSEEGKDFAVRVNKSAQYMDALVSDLLAFSRVSQQRVELSSLDLGIVVESVIGRLHHEICERRASVETQGPWPHVRAHGPTLTQAIFNLVSNALKFVEPGVPPMVKLRAEERGAVIRLWVEDNGIGVAPEYQKQIFGVFTRLNGEKYLGTGIGLAIVQKGIERMGGRVGLESEINQGSRFWAELRRS